MGTITISVDDETETHFRAVVRDKYGSGKGSLGKAVSEALESWTSEQEQDEIARRQIMMMKNARSLGNAKWTRDELHERH